MTRVLISDHVFTDVETERQLLEPLGAELVVAPTTDEADLAVLAAGADAMLVCYAPIPRSVVEAAAGAGCRIIARYGIGYDNIDVEAATQAGITVTNVPDYCLDEVADHTLLLLLAAARRLIAAVDSVHDGGWAFPRDVHRLQGRRLALLGLGRIGYKVAQRALAFGLEVVARDPFVKRFEAPIERASSTEAAVAEADFVSLHLPLSPETRNLVDDAFLDRLRRAPVLVNTSRGGLVDLDAALRALEDGRLGAVALDVTDPEPLPPEHPLREHPRALVTPHMSFFSVEAQHELQRRAAEEVVRVLSGEEPRCRVN